MYFNIIQTIITLQMQQQEKKMNKILDNIKSYPIFKSLDKKEIKDIISSSNGTIKTFSKNNYIYHKGDNINKFGIVLEGKIKIVNEDFWGNQNIISVIEPGEIFAEIFTFLQDTPLNVSVISDTDSKVLLMNINNTNKTNNIQNHNIIFLQNLLNIIANKTFVLNRKIEYLSKRSTKEKILSFLSNQAAQNKKQSFTIPFSRQELADFLAVDRSALSRELSKLQKERIIEFNKNNFRLLK